MAHGALSCGADFLPDALLHFRGARCQPRILINPIFSSTRSANCHLLLDCAKMILAYMFDWFCEPE